MKWSSSPLLVAGLLSAAAVSAHPQFASRAELEKNSALSKRCEAHAASFNKKRYEKRNAKRTAEKRAENATYTITTEAPYYDVIQNDTCVLSPEITWGPYVYPNS